MAPSGKHVPHGDMDESDEETLQPIRPEDITVAIFCALVEESTAVRYTLDAEFACKATGKQSYVYTFGSIAEHKVVIAEPVEMGPVNAAQCAAHVSQQFPNVRLALMVGIGAGIPSDQLDIRLGDIAIGTPRDNHPGVVQYDLGKYEDSAFTLKGTLSKPPRILMGAIRSLEGDELRRKFPSRKILRRIIEQNDKFKRPESEDILFDDTFLHVQTGFDCSACRTSDNKKVVPRQPRLSPDQPVTHRGLILSGGGVIKNPDDRKRLRRGYESAICFEMEAAGIMDELPCLVIRGICDYADTHKHDGWHYYAAAAAAAYCKAVLRKIPSEDIEGTQPMREMMTKVNAIYQTVETTYKAVDGIHATVKDTRATAQALHASDQLDKIRRWLTPPDPSTNFNNAREQHHTGTGQRFLHSDAFTKWKKDRNSFLWLNGIPGCGKTVLSSSVVAELKQGATSPNLVYFYFDFNDVAKQSTEKAVRSLITQLYNSQTDLRKDVDALYSSCHDGGRQPDSASLLQLLQSMFQQAGEIWIVLDALDECRERIGGFAGGLLPWIRNLRNVDSDVHLLVTSRPEQDIQVAIEKFARASEVIALQSDIVSDDINSYIKAHIGEMTRWQNRPDIQHLMETTLIRKANGMFRWVSCQVDILRECVDPLSVETELVNLPRTLDATYARILKNIRTEHMHHAIRLLQFLTYSERPLSVEEAVDAVAVKLTHKPRFHPRYRMPIPDEVAQYCSSLVILVRRQDIDSGEMITEIQLAHFSVQEYLASNRLETSIATDLNYINAGEAIVKVCLSYLIDLTLSNDTVEENASQPFARFSARYWSGYAAMVEASRKEVSQEIDEYLSSGVAYELGYGLYKPDQPWQPPDHSYRAVPALYYASFVGLLYAAQLLLDKGADINTQGGFHGSALQAASSGGHEKVVQLLLDKGADINAQGGFHGSALQAASSKGHEKVVQLLLDKGVDVNAQGGEYGSALQAASSRGHEEVVQLLLDKGADINTQGGFHGSALQAASSGGHEKVVQLLLDKGVDVNAQGGEYGSALQAASSEGHEKVVQLLLDKGADINTQGGFHGSALQAASSGGHEKVVQLLLGKGADMNAQGGEYDNAVD
ncbi:ankyrin repeat domain-containing protein 50 [Microdochium nivale]|nr:ankyrin repeat domain-containing protein 50 [Microdochium nivale]